MDIRVRTRVCLLACLGVGLAAGRPILGVGTAEGTVTGVVPAGLPAGVAVPVAVPIPGGMAAHPVLKGSIQVTGRQAGQVVVQPEAADPIAGTPTRGWFIWAAEADQVGRPIAIRLQADGQAFSAPACRVKYSDPLVEITTPEGKPVLTYRHGRPDPAGKLPLTSYIHPLFGLDGEILTDCSPRDHLHHRGLFWAWVRIQRDGKLVGENWIPRDIGMEAGNVSVGEGPVLGRFAARHYWISGDPAASQPAAASDRLFQEDVVCRVFAPSGGRVIDVDLTLTALQDGLKLGGQTAANKGYGGLTLRFSTEQSKAREPRIIADGKPITQANLNHLKALWVDWTGIFNGPDGQPLKHRSGGALFVHPSHPPLPASSPEWITRTYGPINVAYPGLEMLAVPAGERLRLKYRIWLHRGDAAEGVVDGQYRAYAADWNFKTLDVTGDHFR